MSLTWDKHFDKHMFVLYSGCMQKIGQNIEYFLATLPADQDQTRIRLRAHQVKERYKSVMQTVYRDTAPLFLAHTNNVYIMNKNDVKTLIVYVDESIFAAELNAQRELIKLKLLEQFNENIENFEIYISRGHYKKNHPYLIEDDANLNRTYTPVDLDSTERTYISQTVSTLDSTTVRSSFEKAMTASLTLNKTEKGKTS